MARWLLLLSLAFSLGCNEPRSDPIRAAADPTPFVDAATDAAPIADAGDTLDGPRTYGDAQPRDLDACVPGEEWLARVVVTPARDPMAFQGPLELVVPRLGKRVVVYGLCGATGGGCGDCTKPVRDGISCTLDSTHARVDVGVDEVGPTFVNVRQRGDTIVAEWTHGSFLDPSGEDTPPTHETKVLVRLPCAVKVRFVR